jgi:N-formylglutamate amidohydrolase
LRFREPAQTEASYKPQEDVMNRKDAALAIALAVSFSGFASADRVLTDTQVRAMLTKQGYAAITNVRLDKHTWAVDATAAGKAVKLRISSNTGEVYPDETASQKSQKEILGLIAAAGYTIIVGLRFYGGVWTTKATSSTGKDVELKLDPADGRVIDENVE